MAKNDVEDLLRLKTQRARVETAMQNAAAARKRDSDNYKQEINEARNRISDLEEIIATGDEIVATACRFKSRRTRKLDEAIGRERRVVKAYKDWVEEQEQRIAGYSALILAQMEKSHGETPVSSTEEPPQKQQRRDSSKSKVSLPAAIAKTVIDRLNRMNPIHSR